VLESNLIHVLSETLTFSFLVSFLTLGISAASYKGAVLYPLRLWVRYIYKKDYDKIEAFKAYQLERRKMRQASEWVNPAIEKIELRLMYKTSWAKVILLCVQCMPTLWSAIVFWTIFYEEPIYIWLLGWPISSFINYIISKRFL
jgi:hypothetical protein